MSPSSLTLRSTVRRLLVECTLIVAICFIGAAPAWAAAVLSDVPDVIDPKAKYLFFMHGINLERGGNAARGTDYPGILQALANRGFIVIGEQRSPVANEAYAEKVAAQVKKLLAAGVQANNITVAGNSKGAMISMLVMPIVADPDIAYVNFAGCGREGSGFYGYLGFADQGASKARGRLLSAYARNDRIAGSCKPALDKMTGATVRERVLDNGGGHELFFTPDAAWLDVLQAWAERQQ